MGFEVWIVIVLAASGLSGWIGYAYAKKDAPKQAELDAMAAELDQARQQAETVQADVGEHFEQSAVLFGKLAADYREFLDHFSTSAQNLGLSETRARELLEQGFQPLLTHEEQDDSLVPGDADAGSAVAEPTSVDAPPAEDEKDATDTSVASDEPTSVEEQVSAEKTTAVEEPATADVGEVTVELPDAASADPLSAQEIGTEQKPGKSDSETPQIPEKKQA